MLRLFDARMDIDLRCNYKCPFCWAAYENSTKKTMELSNVCSCLESLKGFCWHVHLSCAGEPLLHPEFENIMEYARINLQRTDTTLITNGFNLNENFAHAICNSEITSVDISVHSLSSELFTKLTGVTRENGVNQVIQNINTLIKVRGNRRFPKIVINSVVMRSTINGLEEIAKWICNSNIDGLRIIWLQPDGSSFSKEEYMPHSKETLNKLVHLRHMLRTHRKYYDDPDMGIFDKLLTVMSGIRFTKRPVEYLFHAFRKFTNRINNKHCNIFGMTLFVNQTGNISICPNGTNSIDHLIYLSPFKITKQIMKTIKTNDYINCQQCGIYASRQVQKNSI